MEGLNLNNAPKFKSPEEELAFLRAHIAERERVLMEAGEKTNKESLAEQVVSEYQKFEPKEVLEKRAVMKEPELEKVVLRLAPEEHDKKIEELFGVLTEKGISNTLALVMKLNNPHLDDDFHRFLVQYLSTTSNIPGLKEGTPLHKTLDMKLFEVSLPDTEDKEGNKKSLKELLGAMEQFYAGMQSVGDDRDNKEERHFVIEIAQPENSENFVIYVAVPSKKADLFEKQLLGVHLDAKIAEVPDDYNIFTENGHIEASKAKLSSFEVFPIKTYETLEYDPLNIILNIFSKLKKTGEGASIQYLICPKDDSTIKRFNNIKEEVKKGASVKDATASFGHAFRKEVGSFIKGFFSNTEEEKDKKDDKKIDEKAIESIEEKTKGTIMGVNIRVVVSAESKDRSNQLMTEIESSFNQFSEANKNGFKFERTKGSDLANLIRLYSYRSYSESDSMPLNLKELSTIFHFPYGIKSPQLKQSKAGDGPAPLEMGEDGLLLGINTYRGRDTKIFMTPEDRLRHLYVIGQTGTGKTTILKNMIIQDIKNGNGCCFIDPHGSDVQDILSHIPKERIDDVIYFDPSYTARPMGLNMLEYDPRYPEQKTFVVNELMGIFNKLFDMKTTGGPMFEQYFKNSAFLAMDDPENHATLLDITRVLSSKEYRDSLLAKCRNPIVREFWANAERTTGDQSIANFIPYITSKFDNFISNDIMRPVVLQEKSVFNFREIMDNKKILLINLAKGRLGEINANLIGLLLVGKIQMAAMSRVDMYGQKMNDFYLYIDEFQNVTTDSIASILSEARKYHLSLTMAHQYVAQLEESIKNAVFGNVGSMIVYRISQEDAKILEPRLNPHFTASDIMKLDNFCSYVSMLIGGIPVRPFSMRSHYTLLEKGNPEIVEKIKELSYLKYGRPREEVEEEIMDKYRN